MLVTGGGCDLHGFIPMLEGQIKIPVVTVTPLARVDTSKLDLSEEQARLVSPVLATPIGLALPEPDKAVKKFNLLPPEVASRIRMKRIQERTIMAAAAVLILLLGFGGWKFYNVHKTQNDEHHPGQYHRAERPSPQVRSGGSSQQRLYGRGQSPCLGAQLRGRLAACPGQPDLDHTFDGEGAVVHRCDPGAGLRFELVDIIGVHDHCVPGH